MAGNNANTATKLEKLPKCYVLFRPHSEWKGEYGFDWIRFKQNKVTTVNGEKGNDHDIKDILGVYSSNCTKTGCEYREGCQNGTSEICQDINSWSTTFNKDSDDESKQYKSLCKKFAIKQIAGWNDTLYMDTPIMTILPSKSAKIKLIVGIQNAPIDGLFWKYDKTLFTLDWTQNVDINKEGIQTIEFNLKCNVAFTSNQEIEVFCDKQKTKLCGSLKILANDSVHQRNINVILIKVKTDIGNGTKTGDFRGGLSSVSNILQQAYINLNDGNNAIKILTIQNFDTNYILNNGEKSIDGKSSLLTYLNNKVSNADSKYNTYFKVYAIDEKCNGGNTLGFSVAGTKSCIVFSGHNKATVPHELLHSLNLPHTFVAKEIDTNAKYTCKALQTDNLMDYSHWNDLERISTYYWQWQIINDKLR